MDYEFKGVQDDELPALRLLFGEDFDLASARGVGGGYAATPGSNAQFIRMRQGQPRAAMRLWSKEKPFVLQKPNLAYRGLVPFIAASLHNEATALTPAYDGLVLIGATWNGAVGDEAAFSIVTVRSGPLGEVPLIILPNDKKMWLQTDRDIRPMLEPKTPQWI